MRVKKVKTGTIGPLPPPLRQRSSSSTVAAPHPVAPNAAAAAVTTTTGVLEEHCDLCWGRDNFAGMMLQRCRDCGINFHCECYGIVARTRKKDPEIQCFACRAVGKTFHVRDRDDNNKRIAVTVKERPTECCLCGTDNGLAFLHCMHPVFDDHGPRGRQILLKATKRKPQRLAWAHTLCCVAICTLTGGCVYGCRQDGSYEGEGADSQIDDDDESVNSALAVTQDGTEGYADITHYVYTLPKNTKRDYAYHQWLHLIEETQRELRCILCGKNDNRKGVLRLAVQCCANDPKEFKEFDGYHRDLHGETCFQPMHVGCAMFRKEEDGSWPREKRVFFFPGSVKKGAQYQEPVVNVFCDAHARDIRVNRPSSAPRLAPPVYKYIVPQRVFTPIQDRKPAPVVRTPEGRTSATIARGEPQVQDRGPSAVARRPEESQDGSFGDIGGVAPSRTPLFEKRLTKVSNIPTPGFSETAKNQEKRGTEELNVSDFVANVKAPKSRSEGDARNTTAHAVRAGTRATALNRIASTMTASLRNASKTPTNSSSKTDSAVIVCKPIPLNQSQGKSVAIGEELSMKNGPPIRIDSFANPPLDTPVAGPKNKRTRVFKISECKLDHYEENELEQKFHDIVQDVQSRVFRESGLPKDLNEIKAEWKEKLNVPLSVFTSVWEKVETTVRMEVEHIESEVEQEETVCEVEHVETESEVGEQEETACEAEQEGKRREEGQQETEREVEQDEIEREVEQVDTKRRFDWSCLVVGPNFDPDYNFSTGEIREEY